MQIDPAQVMRNDMYKLLIGTVVPRPIAWVSSLNAEGVPNLAPFSFFNVACADPPMLLFCPLRRADGSLKDTLRNVQATGEFVVHIVSEELAEVMNQTSAEYPHGMDEFSQIGLRTEASVRVAPPRVADAPVAFECRLEQILHLGGETGSEIVIGRVLLVHLREDVYQNGYIILDALKPVARLAGNGYARVTNTFNMVRPIYTPDQEQS